MSRRRLTHIADTALSATVLTLLASAPVTAIVVYEPSQEPAPERWLPEVPVSVPWADVSLRIPDEWTASVKREPGVEVNGASLVVAFGPGKTMCLLDYYVAETVETWQDAGVRVAATLTIDGHPSERFDDMLGTGSQTASAYSIYAGEQVYALLCTADQAPVDRWRSIAETISVP